MADDAAPYVVNAPDSGMPAMLAHASVASVPAPSRPDDYAWTHSAGVEGFFFAVTIVAVPVAALRWMRRLSALARRRSARRS